MQKQYLGVGETFNFQEIEVKGEKEYTITGYISTKSVDKFNDSITDECLDDMLTQIKSGSIKMDYEHETIHEGDLNKNPIARIIDAKKDDKGLWVKATLNKSNPRFNEIWGSIKDGFLDAFSIAFKPLETATRYIQGKAVRILNKLKLINVGITGTPVNEECRMDKVVIKAIKDLEDDSDDDDEGWEKFDDLDDTELKHKYIKRTGSPGNYTYFYSNKEYEDYKKSKNSNSLFAKEDYKQKVLDSFSKDELKDFKEVLSDENKKDIVQSWFGRNNLGKDYKLNDKFDEMLNEEKGEKHLKEFLMNIPMNKLQEMKKDIKEKPKESSGKPNKNKLIQALTDNNTIKNSESMMPEIIQSGTSKKIRFSIDEDAKKKFSPEKIERTQKLVDALNDADISEEDISQYDDDNIKEEKQKEESNEDKLKKEGFILDEDEARRKAFQEAKEKGKLFNLNTWKKKREEERARILEKKALNNQSYSTSKEEDNKQMAEEIENKPVEETEVKEEQLAEQSENKEVQETTESNNEQNNTAEVEALKSELAEVKSQLAEVQKQLAKPELKALQEAQPITKLGETVTPLGLIG